MKNLWEVKLHIVLLVKNFGSSIFFSLNFTHNGDRLSLGIMTSYCLKTKRRLEKRDILNHKLGGLLSPGGEKSAMFCTFFLNKLRDDCQSKIGEITIYWECCYTVRVKG